MPPLDALTQARIRSLEIVVSWLIARTADIPDPDFDEATMALDYIMKLAEQITAAQEEEDA